MEMDTELMLEYLSAHELSGFLRCSLDRVMYSCGSVFLASLQYLDVYLPDDFPDIHSYMEHYQLIVHQKSTFDNLIYIPPDLINDDGNYGHEIECCVALVEVYNNTVEIQSNIGGLHNVVGLLENCKVSLNNITFFLKLGHVQQQLFEAKMCNSNLSNAEGSIGIKNNLILEDLIKMQKIYYIMEKIILHFEEMILYIVDPIHLKSLHELKTIVQMKEANFKRQIDDLKKQSVYYARMQLASGLTLRSDYQLEGCLNESPSDLVTGADCSGIPNEAVNIAGYKEARKRNLSIDLTADFLPEKKRKPRPPALNLDDINKIAPPEINKGLLTGLMITSKPQDKRLCGPFFSTVEQYELLSATEAPSTHTMYMKSPATLDVQPNEELNSSPPLQEYTTQSPVIGNCDQDYLVPPSVYDQNFGTSENAFGSQFSVPVTSDYINNIVSTSDTVVDDGFTPYLPTFYSDTSVSTMMFNKGQILPEEINQVSAVVLHKDLILRKYLSQSVLCKTISEGHRLKQFCEYDFKTCNKSKKRVIVDQSPSEEERMIRKLLTSEVRANKCPHIGCVISTVGTGSMDELAKHYEKCHSKNSFVCRWCLTSFSRADSEVRHSINVHSKEYLRDCFSSARTRLKYLIEGGHMESSYDALKEFDYRVSLELSKLKSKKVELNQSQPAISELISQEIVKREKMFQKLPVDFKALEGSAPKPQCDIDFVNIDVNQDNDQFDIMAFRRLLKQEPKSLFAYRKQRENEWIHSHNVGYALNVGNNVVSELLSSCRIGEDI